MVNTHQTYISRLNYLSKLMAYVELLKPRLSFLVAFSCAFGYLFASNGAVDWATLTILSISGFLLSGGSVAINQVIEKEFDALMDRTKDRPIPTLRLSEVEALLFGLICCLISIIMLWLYTNPLTVSLSVLSMILYCFVYTPLKRIGSVAVFVGAFPGALPPVLGWIAATGTLSYQAFIIFGIQFIWQFPHFWSIAWVADADYKKAGFKLLPSEGGKDLKSAIQIMTYTLFLIPLGLLPAKVGMSGISSAIVATVCGVVFFLLTLSLIKTTSQESAKRIMFGSFLYLPIVQVAFLLDKI